MSETLCLSRESGHGWGGHVAGSWQQVSPHPVGVMGPRLGHYSIPEPAPQAYTLTPTQLTSLVALGSWRGPLGWCVVLVSQYTLCSFWAGGGPASVWSPALCRAPPQHLGQPRPLGHYCCCPSMASQRPRNSSQSCLACPACPTTLLGHTLCQATPSLIQDSGISPSMPVLVCGALRLSLELMMPWMGL